MKHIELVTNPKMKHYVVEESYKTIRANLLFCSNDMKTILITSCHAHEGKTTSAVELCRSLTEIGKKVLLIDADLRKATVMRRLVTVQEGEIMGLSQYLSGQATIDDVLYHTQLPLMDIIFSGQCPPNPSELVGSTRFKELLDALKEQYDYILVDTPPVGLVIDAAMLAPYCDGAIMVVALGEVSKKFAQDAKQQIEMSGFHIIGVILNEAKQNQKSHIFSKKTKYYRASK